MFKDANVTVMVSDMDRAVKFYVETLGLKLKSRYGDYFAQVEAPGTTIALHPSSKNGPQPGKSESLSIGFGVDDIESAIVLLKDKGVTFSGEVVRDGPVKLAFFTDPDKNPLYLSQTQRWS
jgi:catechol 2,3-dioxygenase-like lactoylglutathione lyase family enzyme